MKQLTVWLNLVTKFGILALIISTLFLFANLTTEFYETPKFLVLIVFTLALLILTTLKFTLAGKVTITRTPLDLPLVLLLVVAIVSTILSASPFVALLGNGTVVYGSLVALIAYVLFYFGLVNNLKSLTELKLINLVLLGAGGVLSIISLIAFFGVKLLPDPWTHGINFTTTGNSFSTSAILALLVPIAAMEILKGKEIKSKGIYAVLLTIFGITIALTGIWATWIAALVGLVLVLWVAKPDYKNPKLAFLAVPIALTAIVLGLSFIPPVGATQNPLYTQYKNFPKEVQLEFPVSWKISVSSFRDNPFWGSGPATYLFDFTNYKPIEFNQSKFWNLRFDSAFNEYLGVLATLGGVGLIALISLTALFISSAWKMLSRRHENESLAFGLAISGIVFFVILALHSATLVVWIIGLLILASFMALNALTSLHEGSHWSGKSGMDKIFMAVSGVVNPDTQSETIKLDALPSILLTISLALSAFTMFFGGKLALADFHHRAAMNAISKNEGLVAYNELVAAEKLNPVNDLYRTDIAQTNFALANAIAIAKGPTESSPAGSFTDQDRANIQTLLQQAINEARTAVTLSPRNAGNWEILGALYRQISGVAENALLFSLDSYGRAIQNDPLNPLLRLNVGGTYYAIQSYDLAIRFFTDAINLKPDFANGFYNLSVALKDKGDLNGAIAAAERALALVEAGSNDQKLANDFLNELKSKVPGTNQPPAASASGALSDEDLPDVVNLPEPSSIATPSAVRRPNSTPDPEPTPTP